MAGMEGGWGRRLGLHMVHLQGRWWWGATGGRKEGGPAGRVRLTGDQWATAPVSGASISLYTAYNQCSLSDSEVDKIFCRGKYACWIVAGDTLAIQSVLQSCFGLSRSNIEIRYWTDINQKTNIWLYWTSSEISDVSALIKINPLCPI